MTALIDHTRLHRTAKYFMDSGRAATHDDAMDILRGFGASIRVGGRDFLVCNAILFFCWLPSC